MAEIQNHQKLKSITAILNQIKRLQLNQTP